MKPWNVGTNDAHKHIRVLRACNMEHRTNASGLKHTGNADDVADGRVPTMLDQPTVEAHWCMSESGRLFIHGPPSQVKDMCFCDIIPRACFTHRVVTV